MFLIQKQFKKFNIFLDRVSHVLVITSQKIRAGNSLIGFLSESLVFLRKNEQMSDSLKKTSDSLIRSFLVSNLSDLLTSLLLVSDLSDSRTSLTKNEGMSE